MATVSFVGKTGKNKVTFSGCENSANPIPEYAGKPFLLPTTGKNNCFAKFYLGKVIFNCKSFFCWKTVHIV